MQPEQEILYCGLTGYGEIDETKCLIVQKADIFKPVLYELDSNEKIYDESGYLVGKIIDERLKIVRFLTKLVLTNGEKTWILFDVPLNFNEISDDQISSEFEINPLGC